MFLTMHINQGGFQVHLWTAMLLVCMCVYVVFVFILTISLMCL